MVMSMSVKVRDFDNMKKHKSQKRSEWEEVADIHTQRTNGRT